MRKILRLGTRGSPLALIQAEDVRGKLLAAHAGTIGDDGIEIVPIRTSGDWRPEQKNRTFLEMGGDKGLFTKEIEEALQSGLVDMAVHSVKDMPCRLPDTLEIAAFLERADPRDAFISATAKNLQDLPPGAKIGTSSLRRQAQILALRPDLKVSALRGNVDTRLRKLADGEADATILAVAGMQRLGIADKISSIFDTKTMLPSAGQGALGIEIRRDDDDTRRVLKPLNIAITNACVTAERAFLLALDGSCQTPIAALAELKDGDQVHLDALAARADGTSIVRMQRHGPAKDAETLGRMLGDELKARLPADFFERAA